MVTGKTYAVPNESLSTSLTNLTLGEPMRLVDLFVRYSWGNGPDYLPLITTAANSKLIEIVDPYMTTKLLKAMGCAL